MKPRKLFLCVLLPLFLLFLFLAGVSFCAAKLIDETAITSRNPAPLDFMSTMTAMQSLNRSIQQAAHQPAGSETVLELTEPEMNALLSNSSMLSATAAQAPQELKNSRLELSKGVFTLLYPYDLGGNTPFGRFINLRIRFYAEVVNGELNVRIVSCHAGAFPLPRAAVQNVLEKQLDKEYRGSPAEKVVRAGVASLKTEKGKFILRVRPYELIQAADRQFSGGNPRIRKTLERIAR